MKLIFAHPVTVPSPAANTVQVVKACSAFSQAGCKTTLALPLDRIGSDKWRQIARIYNPAKRFRILQFPFHGIPGREIWFGTLVGLWAYISRQDVVMTRSITIAWVTTALGVPTVLELHHPVEGLRDVVRRRFATIVGTSKLRLLLVISARLKKHFELAFPVLAGRVLAAPLGGDIVSGAAVPKELPMAFRVGYVGQLYPGKGMEIILPLAKACPWAQFHVVGGVPEETALWRDRAAGLENLTLHGQVPHAQIGPFLEAFDVVLGPYQRVVHGSGGEAQNLADWMSPLKAFEYMAHGKTVIASDLPVLREIFTDGETALLCPPEDVTAWVTALARLRGDPALRKQLGSAARCAMERSFTREARAQKILDYLSSPPPSANTER